MSLELRSLVRSRNTDCHRRKETEGEENFGVLLTLSLPMLALNIAGKLFRSRFSRRLSFDSVSLKTSRFLEPVTVIGAQFLRRSQYRLFNGFLIVQDKPRNLAVREGCHVARLALY